MRTTIAMSPQTRDRLVALKRDWHLRSTEAVIQRLLDRPVLGARALYDARRDAVDAVLQRHQVRKLIAFGSRARGDARLDSDLDLAADFPVADGLRLIDLHDELAKAFEVPVQVVRLAAMGPRLQAALEKEGVVLVQ